MKKYIIISTLLVMATWVRAQEFGFGVKAGLSFSTISGEVAEGESYSYKSGFHVGPTFTFRVTDNFGFRGEVLYNQMGTSYDYEGTSYFLLRNEDESKFIRGQKDMSYNSFMSYIDIPVQVYYRFGEVLEVYGGANLMFLTGGTAGGRLQFNNRNLRPSDIDVRLDYSINSDNVGEAADGEGQGYLHSSTNYTVPDALGAYYEFDEDKGRLWNTLDYGLHAGARIMFNDALYLEGRAYFGFNDVTNNDLDYHQNLPEGQLQPTRSSDDDRNMGFNVSLGFSF